MNIIGSDNIDLLDVIKDIPSHKFGIYFDFRPDDEEKTNFEQSLISAIQNKEINSAQYNKARQIRNVKSAIKYLEIVIQENIEKQEAFKVRAIREQAEANAQTAVLSERSKQQTATIEWEIKKNEILLKDKLEAKNRKEKALLEDLLDDRKHQRTMELASVQRATTLEALQQAEKGKNERINLESSNQSVLNEQKQKGLPPIDFTNDIDKLLQEETENLTPNTNITN